ncbi:MAG TPA: sigma-70 family RNA polymerase sigma factor [Chryseolinea sp.]
MGKHILLKEKTGLENLPDIDIIERMSFSEHDAAKSHEAFAEFHRRYAEFIYSTCFYVCRMLPEPDEAAADLTERILVRSFSYAASYNPNRASVKTWLSKIAQNEFNDYYSEYRKHHPLAAEDDRNDTISIDSVDHEKVDRTKVNGGRIEMALDSLTPMEKDIVLVHMMYKDIDNLDSQIPKPVMDELCVRYDKKPHAIRKIKSRALIKIKAFILDK